MPAAGDTVPTNSIHCSNTNCLQSLIMWMYKGHLPGVEQPSRALCSETGARENGPASVNLKGDRGHGGGGNAGGCGDGGINGEMTRSTRRSGNGGDSKGNEHNYGRKRTGIGDGVGRTCGPSVHPSDTLSVRPTDYRLSNPPGDRPTAM